MAAEAPRLAIVGLVSSLPAGPIPVAPPAAAGPTWIVPAQSEAPPEADLDPPLTAEELAWAQAAWAYFAGPPVSLTAPPPPPPPPVVRCDCCCGQDGTDAPPPPLAPPRPGLVPLRAGAPVATMWSVGDQLAATVLARRLGLIGDRELDERLTRLVAWLNNAPLAFDELPNRFYSTDTGAMLGEDLQEGLAGWSAVDMGRLLVWLRIAAEEHPQFASYIRNAAARLSVCGVLSDDGRLQSARPGESGTEFAPETPRGYDAYAIQGYRAWGLDLPLPLAGPAPFEIEVDGLRFPLTEDTTAEAPVMTTPPAYMGLEFDFLTLGPVSGEAVAGGRDAEALMTAVHDLQAQRLSQAGIPTARADFRRSEEPFSAFGTLLANGYRWTTIDPGGAARENLALVSTRAAFGLDAFFDGPLTDTLMSLTRELHDPNLGWYEGRYERSGAYETTRTSVTNAFVLEAIAHRRFGPLFDRAARPAALGPALEAGGRCRLPLAAVQAP